MSYQNLGDDNQGGYGQYNPYGSQQNPYAAQQQPSNTPPSYGYGGGYGQAGAMEQGNGGYGKFQEPTRVSGGSPNYLDGACFRDAKKPSTTDTTITIEMSNMGQSGGPTAILQKCRELKEGISELAQKRETQLKAAQNTLIESNTGKEDAISRQNLDYVEDEMNTALRYLRDQYKRIKETPGSGDSRCQGQVTKVGQDLKEEIRLYQATQSDFQKRLAEQVRRRYQIANPEATPDEVERGVELVIQGQEQAFMTPGTRSRQANDARQATMARSAAIRKIEQDMTELANMFRDVNELITQQEPAVTQISQGAEETHRNVQQANTKLDSAITSARNARRWKWYALIIVSK
ncbi:t-SNARE [Penicillium macrosclerotiorum]|uniref:t-SNARE n=1 Tax=Penicillium macrosclerotiorum TaxID=303699 RepID=UPI0025483617|nr:t-SNARE [Penicillium macrosclerotiorum]KAJ5698087.1 t-SNARE [Penicillium macrosclerotiorum]